MYAKITSEHLPALFLIFSYLPEKKMPKRLMRRPNPIKEIIGAIQLIEWYYWTKYNPGKCEMSDEVWREEKSPWKWAWMDHGPRRFVCWLLGHKEISLPSYTSEDGNWLYLEAECLRCKYSSSIPVEIGKE